MNKKAINPIRRIRPIGGTWQTVPPPSSYVWELQDTSASDAGRTESGRMYKHRIGQVEAVQLAWQNKKTKDVNTVLRAFNAEYVEIELIDPLSGDPNDDYFNTLVFYVGNRSSPMYNASLGLWSNISFNIIDRNGAEKK
ncbi:MAG: hypothetical protein NC122_05095 [Faecalibacterium sp.]|nr:hypothetical protein [Ruminococcus sp.]MCM1391862.1 hypothetical protein [Ruminococcus sp.]MCM1485562.1 hypothetical protein [Faecalibacterium sp.]